jgi:signal peptidase I
MSNIDDPGFAISLLAILAGLRLAFFVVQRAVATPAPVAAPALTPDDVEDTAVAPAAAANVDTGLPPTQAIMRFVSELLDSALVAVVLFFFIIRPFVMQAFFIPSGSMLPTLAQGDKLVATKYTYHIREPRIGDVVVFRAPETALRLIGQPVHARQNIDYVKRVIALPRDRVRVVAGEGVYVNGTLLDEPYARSLPDYDFPVTHNGDIAIKFGNVRQELLPHIENRELVVPPGYLFVMGDNRNESHDSHIWGLLERKALIGKAVLIFWPPSRMGAIH